MKTVAILGKGDIVWDIWEIVEELEWDTIATVPAVEPGEFPTFAAKYGDPVMTADEVPPVDLVISVGYDKILKPEFLERHGLCLNLHNSPLPRYRGMRPINWALKNGEQSHGVTLHKIDEGIDTGPVYGQIDFPIWPEIDEVRDVYERCCRYGLELCRDVLPRLDQIIPMPQTNWPLASYYGAEDIEALGDRKDWTRESSV